MSAAVDMVVTRPGSGSTQPFVIGLLRLSLLLYAGLAVIGVGVSVMTQPPLHMLLGVLACGVMAIGYFAGWRWLANRQADGLLLAVMANVIGLVVGWVSVPDGGVSLTAIGSAFVLFIVVLEVRRVGRWLVPSSGHHPRRGWLVVAALLAGVLAPGIPSIAEPTRATARDVSLDLSVICAVQVPFTYGGPDGAEHQTQATGMIVNADVTWSRVEPLPGGLGGPSVVDHLQVAQIPGWTMLRVRSFDAGTGADVGGIGIGPGGAGVDQSAYTAAIGFDELQPGRTIRLQVTLMPSDLGAVPRWEELRIDASYWHLDRFKLEVLGDCAGNVDRYYSGPLD